MPDLSMPAEAPSEPGGAVDPIRRFRMTVAAGPDRVAVVAGDGALSFAGLDARVARVAAALRSRRIGRGHAVVVCMPRRTDLIVALLGVWRAGAAFVPVDPSYPVRRQLLMAEDAGARLVIADRPAAHWGEGLGVLTLDDLPAVARGGPVAPSAADPAYVIYTSGSTGRPKGVQVSRGNVAHLVRALEAAGLYADRPRVVACNASVSFDASVQQWVRVCRGDTVALLDEESRADPVLLAGELRRLGVTDLDITPTHLATVYEHLLGRPGGTPLRLFVGGEAIPQRMWSDLSAATERGALESINVYGPTETTVDTTAARIGPGRPHIGRPLPGVRVSVLDDRLRRAPPGSAGELYIGGPGVTHGYLNRAGLTAGRFLPEPGGRAGSRMYRTGDRVRWRPDGVLEYLGRADRQVKLNGYRIEPGEIETVFATHPGVSHAVVLVRDNAALGPRLVLYYRPAAGCPPPPATALREHAAASLPDFMLPADFVALESFPLTVSGKVDLAALPEPVVVRHAGTTDLPSTPVERLVAEVWGEVLGRDTVLVTDNFFALGGHSLVALRLVATLKARLGLTMPTAAVYAHPGLADLAGHIEGLLDPAAKPVSAMDSRPLRAPRT